MDSEAAREFGSEEEKSLQDQKISEEDIKSAFKAVDIDKSGEISKRVRQYFTK